MRPRLVGGKTLRVDVVTSVSPAQAAMAGALIGGLLVVILFTLSWWLE